MTGYESKKKAASAKLVVTDLDGHVVGKTRKKRPWLGLTDEEIEFIYADTGYNDIQMFARAIEAKLKDKNI